MTYTFDKSAKLFSEARKWFPGGVNSPVRAFKAIGATPLFVEKAEGAYIFDADGNRFLDFCCSWGPLILGHAHPEVVTAIQDTAALGSSFGAPTRLENELAELILDHHDKIEQIRFVNSGTEAVMSAIRLARGITQRDKVLKFEGCYHGHVDSLLVKAGSGLATLGTSTSAGIPRGFSEETVVAPLNDLEALEHAFEQYGAQMACAIIEPVPANNGLLIQSETFLRRLRSLCDKHCVLLIFDEVISGFRLGFTGAAGMMDMQPDLITFGKIIGGGLPVGAYGGSRKFMQHIAPEGPVYQAGTLSGNPLAMAAGKAQLTECLKVGFYDSLEHKTSVFVQDCNDAFTNAQVPVRVTNQGSVFWLYIPSGDTIRSADQITDTEWFAPFYRALLQEGIYLGPSPFEVGFVSQAHSEQQLKQATEAMARAAKDVWVAR